MDNRQQQVEKIADILCESKNHNCNGEDCKCIKQATDLYNANCRILNEGSVVISKEEYEDLKMLETKYGLPPCMDGCITAYGHRLMTGEQLVDQARKQAIKEYVELLNSKMEERSCGEIKYKQGIFFDYMLEEMARKCGVEM